MGLTAFARRVLASVAVVAVAAGGLGGAVMYSSSNDAEAAGTDDPLSITGFINGQPNGLWSMDSQYPSGNGSEDLSFGGVTLPLYPTSDGWFRLQAGRTNFVSNVLLNAPFSTEHGFTTSFDYRAHRLGTNWIEVGGLSLYLVDGDQGLQLGDPRGALGYAQSNYPGGRGGIDGYLALGISGTGVWAYNGLNYGGSVPFYSNNTMNIGLRGSGKSQGVPAADKNLQYPWFGGVEFPTFTGYGNSAPVADPNSEYRRVEVSGRKHGSSMQIVVKASDPTRKNQASKGMKEYFRGDLNDPNMFHQNYPQAPLPKTLKLGFSSSSGAAAAAWIDIRNVRIDATTDVAVTGALDSNVPANADGKYERGSTVGFEWTATNHGPAPIGNPLSDPKSVARFKSDLASLSNVLDFNTATWTCTATGGAWCETSSGTGIDAMSNFRAPDTGAITLRLQADVRADAPLGVYKAKALTPTDFTNNTLTYDMPWLQMNERVVDGDLSNNSAEISFEVANPAIALSVHATPNDVASYKVGQQITYTHTVTNMGSSNMNSVAIVQDSFDGSGTLSPLAYGSWPGGSAGKLPGGGAVTATRTYTLTQADIDAGAVVYKVHAEGVPNGKTVSTPIKVVTLTGQMVDVNQSSVTMTPGDKAADDSDYHTVTIALKDSNGQPIGNRLSSLSANLTMPNGANARLGSMTEDTPGTYKVNVYATRPGQQTVQVNYRVIGRLGEVSGNFVAGAPAVAIMSVDKDDLFVRETATATVQVWDIQGNPCTSGSINFTSNSVNLFLGTKTVALSNGIATLPVTSTVPGG
ncbi:MAG: hypothetical protein FWD59_09480, partial [Micrococcales bacterium]|nr:hypothetical protein [Micrococcales bacterium]